MNEEKSMKETEEAKIKIGQTVENKSILEGYFDRNSVDGLNINLKSRIDWKLFSTGDDKTFNIGGVECWRPRINQVDGTKSCFIAENTFEYNNFPNLALILACNIRNGVDFKFGMTPISDEKAAKFVADLKRDMKIIFLTYCRPLNIKFNFSSSIVENEEF